jgi:Cof subfamily protein (haloacid dehalogenase superfamily)
MRQDIKLMIADIDRTLVNEHKKLMPLTKKALLHLHEEGVMVGIASGRPIANQLEKRYKEYNLPWQFDLILGINGGEVLDHNSKTIRRYHPLSKETIKEIMDMMAPLHENCFVYRDGYMLCIDRDPGMIASSIRNDEPAIEVHDLAELYSQDAGKLNYRIDDPQRLHKALAFARDHPSDKYDVFQTGPTMIEFEDPRVSKGKSLKAYCEENGIRSDQVLSFGDTTNDNEMLEYAGTGVAMRNSTADTLQCADAITEYDYNHDGVGHYLFDHIL